MICQQVTLSGDAEWPKVADAVIEAHMGLDHGMGHLASMRPEKNERLPPIKVETKGDLAILSHHHKQARG